MLMKYVSFGIYLSPLSNSTTAIYFILIALVNIIQLYIKFNYSFNFSRIMCEVDVCGQAICTYNYCLCVLLSTFNYKTTNGDFILAFLMNFVLAYIVVMVRRSNWNSKLYKNLLDIKSMQGQEIFVYRMIECIQRYSFEDQLVLNGFLKYHKLTCSHKKCLCKFGKLIASDIDMEQRDLLIKMKFQGIDEGLDFKKGQGQASYLDQNKISPGKYNSTSVGFNNRESQINLDQIDHQNIQNAQQEQYVIDYQQLLRKPQNVRYQGMYAQIKSSKQIQLMNLLCNWLEILYVEQGQKRAKILEGFIQSKIAGKDIYALFILSVISQDSLNFQESTAIFCYQKIINDQVNNKLSKLTKTSLNVLDIQKQVQFEHKMARFYHHIDQSILKVQGIWSTLNKNYEGSLSKDELKSGGNLNLDIQQIAGQNQNQQQNQDNVTSSEFAQLYKDLVSMTNQAQKVLDKYNSIRELMPNYIQVILCYDIFIRQVINYEYDSIKLQQLINALKQKRKIMNSSQQSLDLFDMNQKIGVIVISGLEKQLGKMKLVNLEVTNITGHKISRLINSNVSVILPDEINETIHNKFISKFLTRKPKSTYINQPQILWVKRTNGFILPINFIVQPFFDQLQGLQFIAFMKTFKESPYENVLSKNYSEDYFTILSDRNGKIIGSSENFANIFKYQNISELKYQDFNIFDMGPEILGMLDNRSSKNERKVYFNVTDQTTPNINNIIQQSLISYKFDIKEQDTESKTKLSSHLSRQTSKVSDDEGQEQDISQGYDISPSNRQNFLFTRMNTTSAYVKADLRFLNKCQELSICVFYVALDKNSGINYTQNKNLIIEPSTISQLNAAEQDHISYEDNNSQSMSSQTSNSNNLQHLKNLKEDINQDAKPKQVALLQKYLLLYTVVFLTLAITANVLARNEGKTLISDFNLYSKCKHLFGDIVELRQGFQDYVLLVNNETIKQLSIIKDRVQYLKQDMQDGLQTIKTLANEIE
ncbi:pas domain s-box family protein [Stylonychia lemnae]|uniref:Pas domain s-box family protein n=1 Tax=Stylonychia lemnae TaxID=5949 RepID=A0A078ARR2_STYLE|nr:pas domain s-box family protein [Stylonychia lemnae]|eukprot:CDW84676.1 pas domain s-box family protein [Stylonychia lemnae]